MNLNNEFQRRSKVRDLKNEGFVVTWASSVQDGSSNGVYAKIFGTNNLIFNYTGTNGNDIFQYDGTDNLNATGLAGNDTISGNIGNDSISGDSGDDLLFSFDGFDTISGGVGDDTVNGGKGNDRINAGTGNDSLDGGGGKDTLNGGTGNDIYIVDATIVTDTDIVVETNTITTEIDLVKAIGSYTLSANLENIILLGSSHVNGIGNNLHNLMTGNTGNNLLDGSVGNDTLNSLLGDDTVNGGKGNDRINAGTGNDSLDGGGGKDTLNGGTGNDIYIVDATIVTDTDIVVETNTITTEIDLVKAIGSYTLSANLENIILLGSSHVNGIGNNLHNLMTGNTGNNLLDGSVGNDTLNSLLGNDTLNGGKGNDSLNAGTGNDSLDGGGGKDTLNGGTGNDIYIVDATIVTDTDIVVETNTITTEIDLVKAIGSYTLSANLENIILLGSSHVNGIGNNLHNLMTGNTGNNLLDGSVGNDTLNSLLGNDTLNGGAGNDSLNGGTGNDNLDGGSGNDLLLGGSDSDHLFLGEGKDTLTGGNGNDIFSMSKNTGSNLVDADIISDFVKGQDLIELTGGLTFADLNISQGIGDQESNTIIKDSNSQTILAILQKVNSQTIDSSNFLANNPGILSFSGTDFSVNEDGSPVAEVTIIRTDGSNGAVSATVTLTDGTATAPDDYNNSPITVNFAEDEITKTVTIPIVDDNISEGDETFKLELTNPTGGASIGSQNIATQTIIDNDTIGSEFLGELNVTQDSIFTGESTPITFNVTVSDPSNVPEVEIYESDGNGNVNLLGKLLDNGDLASGDDITGDGVFSNKFYFNPTAPGEKFYFAAIPNSNEETQLTKIEIYDPLNQEEFQETLDLNNEIDQQAEAMFNSGQTDEQILAFVQSTLEANPNQVNLDSIVSTGSNITWETPEGIKVVFNTNEYSGEEKSGSSSSRQKSVITIPQVTPESMEEEGGCNKAIVLAPYAWQFEPQDESDEIAQKLRDKGFDVVEKRNGAKGTQNITVEDFKNLDEYDAVVISTHGDNIGSTNAYFATGQSVDPSNKLLYAFDLLSQRLVISTKSNTYRVTSSFIGKYTGEMHKSIIYASACRSTFNNSLANAFISKGAAAYIGYSDYVGTGFAYTRGQKAFDILLAGKTTGEIPGINVDVENDSDPAKFQLIGSNTATLSLAQLKNGDFEKNNLKCWTKEGDARVISALGPLAPPEGKLMAIVSTGLGSVSDSQSKISQKFLVPQNADDLVFTYDVVSEEPMEYVGSQFDDKFELLINGQQVVMESINTSSWTPVSGIDFAGGDSTTFHTGFKTKTFDLNPFRGQTVNLEIRTFDLGDSIYDTAALIDNIKVTTV